MKADIQRKYKRVLDAVRAAFPALRVTDLVQDFGHAYYIGVKAGDRRNAWEIERHHASGGAHLVTNDDGEVTGETAWGDPPPYREAVTGFPAYADQNEALRDLIKSIAAFAGVAPHVMAPMQDMAAEQMPVVVEAIEAAPQ